MTEKIIQIIKQYVNEGLVIDRETNLITDLGLTSFDLATMAADFEDEFEISIETAEMMEIKTVGDIESCIRRYVK
ncbi:MAG: acyl carrier protein [Oscillospiraceae bacterium]|nr:acyl carrier protein [Oscillospiraceae bacterium]